MSSEAAKAMSNIVAGVAPLLKDAGFRKHRHRFNRRTADALIDVVQFQMGASPPPGAVDNPPYRVNRYGQFTINLGIYCHEMRTVGAPGRNDGWIREPSRQMRQRVGFLMPDSSDVWWPLHDEAYAVEVCSRVLADYGLPWFDRYATRASILEAFRRGEARELGMGPRGAVDISALLLAMGEEAEARNVLVAYLRRTDLQPSHRRAVLDYAREQRLNVSRAGKCGCDGDVVNGLRRLVELGT